MLFISLAGLATAALEGRHNVCRNSFLQPTPGILSQCSFKATGFMHAIFLFYLYSTLLLFHVSLPQTTYRGVKNPEAVERKKKKQEEAEKQAMNTSVSGGGGLKVGPSSSSRSVCGGLLGRGQPDCYSG